MSATHIKGNKVYAFRRRGQDSFCTCDEARYLELSDKPHLFEVAVFYTDEPDNATRCELTDEEITDLVMFRHKVGNALGRIFNEVWSDGTLADQIIDKLQTLASKEKGT